MAGEEWHQKYVGNSIKDMGRLICLIAESCPGMRHTVYFTYGFHMAVATKIKRLEREVILPAVTYSYIYNHFFRLLASKRNHTPEAA